MPRVSIVLPCWNGERFLEQSIKSILNQSFKDWELIIVNDCSTDNSPKIAEEYAKKDKRIRVIHNKVNKKLPATLNVGFSHAKGEYFTWTSDDNIAKPNWLSVLVDYLDKHSDVDMVSATMDYIDEDNNLLFKVYPQKTPLTLTYKCNVGAAFMYRKTIADKIGGYDENTFCAEDYDYWCRIALNGVLKYIPDNIYMYRTNSQSLTALQKPKILEKTTYIQKKYKQDFIKRFNLKYWDIVKIEYLSKNRKYRPAFVVLDTYKFLLRNISNLLFFWNKDLRQKIYSKLQVQL